MAGALEIGGMSPRESHSEELQQLIEENQELRKLRIENDEVMRLKAQEHMEVGFCHSALQ
jgi:hypothetical protein